MNGDGGRPVPFAAAGTAKADCCGGVEGAESDAACGVALEGCCCCLLFCSRRCTCSSSRRFSDSATSLASLSASSCRCIRWMTLACSLSALSAIGLAAAAAASETVASARAVSDEAVEATESGVLGLAPAAVCRLSDLRRFLLGLRSEAAADTAAAAAV